MNKDNPAFLIETSVLKSMLEDDGENKGKELLDKFLLMKSKGIKIKCFTTNASLLRAIWLSKPDNKIENLQKLIGILDILPSYANFANEKEVVEEIITVAKTLSERGK